MRRPRIDDGPDERALEKLFAHRFGPLVEGLTEEESFVVKQMFGLLACYVHGKLMLVLGDKRPPWSGIMAVTDRDRQPALRAAVKSLRVHPVLGKWLLLRPTVPTFEEDALRLADMARADDPRLGAEPKPRRAGRGGRRRPAARR